MAKRTGTQTAKTGLTLAGFMAAREAKRETKTARASDRPTLYGAERIETSDGLLAVGLHVPVAKSGPNEGQFLTVDGGTGDGRRIPEVTGFYLNAGSKAPRGAKSAYVVLSMLESRDGFSDDFRELVERMFIRLRDRWLMAQAKGTPLADLVAGRVEAD